MKMIAWLGSALLAAGSALALLLAAPGAASSVKAEGKMSVVPPGENFTLSGGACPLTVWSFDRDGDGEPDRIVVELDLACSARARSALKELKSAGEDAMKRLSPPAPKPARGL